MSSRSVLTSLAAAFAFPLLACAKGPSPAQPNPSPASPGGRSDASVSLTYLGSAGWQVADGAHSLLIDPYFSRIEDEHPIALPDEAAIARYAPAHADAILVGHSHHDHLLDVPSIAKRTGATVVGSESTLNVARAAGVPEGRFILVRGGETFAIGPFSVHPVRGLHGITGGNLTGTIPRDIKLPMTTDEYAVAEVFQYLIRVEGRTIFVIGTANFIESEVQGLRPDVAIIAGPADKVPDYSCRLMRALGRPPIVLANHFDNQWEPLGPKQMDNETERRANLARFEKEIHACAPNTKVVVPTHFRPISI